MRPRRDRLRHRRDDASHRGRCESTLTTRVTTDDASHRGRRESPRTARATADGTTTANATPNTGIRAAAHRSPPPNADIPHPFQGHAPRPAARHTAPQPRKGAGVRALVGTACGIAEMTRVIADDASHHGQHGRPQTTIHPGRREPALLTCRPDVCRRIAPETRKVCGCGESAAAHLDPGLTSCSSPRTAGARPRSAARGRGRLPRPRCRVRGPLRCRGGRGRCRS